MGSTFSTNPLALAVALALASVPVSQAGDILRGGTGAAPTVNAPTATSGAATAQAAKAQANARDSLARTTAALQSVKAMQAAARQVALAGPNNLGNNPNFTGKILPNVPNGLVIGGLKTAPGVPLDLAKPTATENPALWVGAKLPTQKIAGGKTNVTIVQTSSQALLNWETFNIGKKTAVTFDQTAGGNDSSKWIAFNKISDPTGNPTQILGSLDAIGQIYLINQNGILFGGSSQINTRTLAASSLPINSNLVAQGLLNNRDAQFLFSGLSVPGGSDGTPDFIPDAPINGKFGDIIVQRGAQIGSPPSADGNGGRVILVGANVTNAGTLSTSSGQTILAAGLQVGIAAHASNDPSLRGLDVFVGNVGDYAGTVTNVGQIEVPTGSILLVGRTINQNGVLNSTTSVALNGRLDLLASYGAVSNPNYDNADAAGGGGPAFINQFTGTISLGKNSATSILPDYASDKNVPGTDLPEHSQINLEGFSIEMQNSALLFAPNADVAFRSGKWTYVDVDDNRSIFKADGTSVEDALISNFAGGSQRFFYSSGQVFLDSGSLLDVSGSTDVFVPLTQNILTVQLRGSELADSPLQRDSILRGKPLTVDIRESGAYGGQYWLGSPLGDLTGVAGIIARNAAQLTVNGGTVDIHSGGSIAIQPGAKINVSGGYLTHEAGVVQTSRLMQDGRVVEITDATPDQTYDGIYDGISTQVFAKYGITNTYSQPLALLGATYQDQYIQGAAGGKINFTAPTVVVGGELIGQTINGPKQLDTPADLASLSFNFKAETRYEVSSTDVRFFDISPTPVKIEFSPAKPSASAFLLVDGKALPTSLTSQFTISTTWWDEKDGGGFGNISVENSDGSLDLQPGLKVNIPAGGSFTATSANIKIGGEIKAPGGSLSLTAYNFSPYEYLRLSAADALANQPAPGVVANRGAITVGSQAILDVSGLQLDERIPAEQLTPSQHALDGGSIQAVAYSINLSAGSRVSAAGGALVSANTKYQYGNGGKIELLAGRDPDLATSIGGKLTLDGNLSAIAAAKGGSLSIRSSLIQIGGHSTNPAALHLSSQFFQTGGFTQYSLTGIGQSSGIADGLYLPAIRIAEGTILEPRAEKLLLVPTQETQGALSLVPVLQPIGQRQAVSLEFTATGADDTFTTDLLEARGDIVVEKNTLIRVDPGANVSFGTDAGLTKTQADSITLLGSIEAPGGTIAAFTRNKFRLAPDLEASATAALPTVYLGENARLSVAGAVVYTPDAFGRRVGNLYSGGTLSISGNIVAEAGAVLDVSGTSGLFDLALAQLGGNAEAAFPVSSGINSPLYRLKTVETRQDSNGGTLNLRGAEMLLSDATLLGKAGGLTATGGSLSVFSGRYYRPGAFRTSADINLTVSQSELALAVGGTERGTGLAVTDSEGAMVTGAGYFTADRFAQGGFASLDLGYDYLADARPIAYGGNISFVGPVSIAATGSLRLAGGGIVQADSRVDLLASYLAVGQKFRPPVNPADPLFIPFLQDPIAVGETAQFYPTPTAGPGAIRFSADLIDIGTTIFQNTTKVVFGTPNGDIRGDGTLSVAGNLTLSAGQVYPNTLATFSIFAYDTALAPGSVTISGSGARPVPYSVGGNIGIYASSISQNGSIRAPFGTITLGWDGSDLDPATTLLEGPQNSIVGLKIATPITSTVTLSSQSSTSVSAVSATGEGLVIPYGLSTDGLSLLDPRGVNVTVNGLPEKRITIAGDSVTFNRGTSIDIRGGGDLLSYRWISGTGGSRDLLGEAVGAWGAAAEYSAGDLVTYNGKTWSARVSIVPANFQTPPAPDVSIYWSEVPESYAVVPGYDAAYAPYASNNTGSNATSLGGDPGYTSAKLKLGDQIYLDGVDGLQTGTYTLLPRRYALLPGAVLVTPQAGMVYSPFTKEDGSIQTSGYRENAFASPVQNSGIRSSFEIASAAVVASRVQYDIFGASDFITAATDRLGSDSLQELPRDAGYLVFQGNKALFLTGKVLTSHLTTGRGAAIDVSSNADIYITSGTAATPSDSNVVLGDDVLSSWGAESLLIGGIRNKISGDTILDTRTTNIVLDNPGGRLAAPEITLAAKAGLTVTSGSAIASLGMMSRPSDNLIIQGDGALLRVSGDSATTISRIASQTSTTAFLTIGDRAKISGAGVVLDSSYATSLSSNALLTASSLTLGSGQISIVFDAPADGLPGSEVPSQLVLQDKLLQYVQSVDSLTLSSYRTIDIYGSGTFGDSRLQNLNLFASGIRGSEGSAVLRANSITFANPLGNESSATATDASSGTLQIQSRTMQLGAGPFNVAGYRYLKLSAVDGLLTTADGSLSVAGSLEVSTPLITGLRGISYDISAADDIALLATREGGEVAGGLGASLSFTGASITANARIDLAGGKLVLHALDDDLKIGGTLSVAGTSQKFYDLTRFADAGQIELISDDDDIIIDKGAIISVAADRKGGNAGLLSIHASTGLFNNLGTLQGSAAKDNATGSFSLDAQSITSFGSINQPLEEGGFYEARNIRLRTGNIVIDELARSRSFTLSADQGSISVSSGGFVDASGKTGGSITLIARDDLSLQSGAKLSVAGTKFSTAGKGGSIRLEAGAQQNGTLTTSALLTLEAGSSIDLSVASYVAGGIDTVNSSAFNGQYEGKLHLRAPQDGDNVGVGNIQSTIVGGSSLQVEAYRLYDITGDGVLNTRLRNTINTDAIAFMTANESGIRSRLLADNSQSAALNTILVLSPGVEIINQTGDLTLGLANPTGSTNPEALSAADWDFSTFRYGTNAAPGILTLRAKGDVVFNNTLSDGFTPVSATTVNGNSALWLGTLQTINSQLPVNTQSWTFRLSAGADLGAVDFRSTLRNEELESGKGSLLVGEVYPAVPNSQSVGAASAVGLNGLTANSIRISTTTANRGTRYEVIRTGTGDIDISTGRDVQLRNQFATIYTAGVALPTPSSVFQADDFVIPNIPVRAGTHPSQSGSQGVTIGAIQQFTQPAWSLAGGDITISAQANIGHYTTDDGTATGRLIIDSSRQMPTNWLYRRSYVTSAGIFASDGGVVGTPPITSVTDSSTSTTWWIDFSNFFEGVGALGGGNVSVNAGNDVVNLDAVAPTNARMAGRDPVTGGNLMPDQKNLLELGGGDVRVRAGNDISGGVYYVERGQGSLFAGGAITTNEARSPELGILDTSGIEPYNSSAWLPTTLYVGKSSFEVTALKDVLLGPVTNPFLLPQGINNKFWYKTYFQTFSPDAGVVVASYGGSVTHRQVVTLPAAASPDSILSLWFNTQNLYNGTASASNASYYQPWLRLVEVGLESFQQIFTLSAPNLTSSAFGGDINLVGSSTLFPSATGNVELAASGNILGLQSTGKGFLINQNVNVYTSSTINLSDADPRQLPGITNPIAYQSFVGRSRTAALQSSFNVYSNVNQTLRETGSYTGQSSSINVKRNLHAGNILHSGDSNPVRLYALEGDITGLTLFSPKATRAIAAQDITDIAFYIQNVAGDDISLVSAGRDIVPYNENAPLRVIASDSAQGNYIADPTARTVTGNLSNVLAGDIQINGPGTLEVLAGRNLDLGTGPNYADGTGVGIVSIGNVRNPFLQFEGADLILQTGITGMDNTGPALGLSQSSLDFSTFAADYEAQTVSFDSAYLNKIKENDFSALTSEQQAIVLLEVFYSTLRDAGRSFSTTQSYQAGFAAVTSLYGTSSPTGDLFTRARDIRTTNGGAISLSASSGGVTLASDIFGNPLTPPGIVTEYGGAISLFTNADVDIGRARIFTLRGGDIVIWSSAGNIAAGSAAKTVVTAPPTRVVIDTTSADVVTDLGGLATGGGIGVLASVEGVAPGDVDLIAPAGFVDAGDAGIRTTGNLNIAAIQVLNADNIVASGTSTGVPTVVAPSINLTGLTAASTAAGAGAQTATSAASQNEKPSQQEELPSIITVEVLGYGG